MKNTIKLFGIVALAAVIGFSFSSCGGNGGGGNNNNSLRITGITQDQMDAGYHFALYSVFPANADISDVRADVIAYFISPDPSHSFQAIAGNYVTGTEMNGIIFAGTAAPFTATVPLYSAATAFGSRWSGTHTSVYVWIVLVNNAGNYVAFQTDSVQAFTGGQLTLHAQNDFSQVSSGSMHD